MAREILSITFVVVEITLEQLFTRVVTNPCEFVISLPSWAAVVVALTLFSVKPLALGALAEVQVIAAHER